jgi:molybdopterin/thiamine biosynthesis adenylyltransferase
VNGQSASGVGIAVIGCGNIGSQTVPLLGGIDGVERVLLIDPDRYEAPNVGRQRFPPAAVGKPKVQVQARVLRRLAPHLDVVPLAQHIEAVPFGDLREKVLISCVDSRTARQTINRISFALGTPWIDAGLDRSGQVRARAYLPQDSDCMECAWSSRDYELLEQRVPCVGTADTGSMPQVGETAAAQELGAVAAGLQVALLRNLLSGGHHAPDTLGRQWFYDVASGRGWTGTYTPNPACRIDHARWAITDLARSASELTLRAALALRDGDGARSALAVEGQMFVHRLRCPRCGASRDAAGRLDTRIAARSCRRCSATMTASAADVTDVFTSRTASARALDAPLSRLGLVDGDIFTLRSPVGTAHYHLRGAPPEAC